MAKVTPKQAIKLFCKECVCDQIDEIRNCTATKCPLYDFRPFKSAGKKESEKSTVKSERGAKIMTDEHKAKMKAAKAKKQAERVEAGLPATNRVKKVKPVVAAKSTKKSATAKARMTDAQKEKMRIGRQNKAAARKAQLEGLVSSTPKSSPTTPVKTAVSKRSGMRTARGPEDL